MRMRGVRRLLMSFTTVQSKSCHYMYNITYFVCHLRYFGVLVCSYFVNLC